MRVWSLGSAVRGGVMAGVLAAAGCRSNTEPLDATRRISAVALGEDHSCLLRANGTVECWGLNAFGALGDGTTDSRDRPTTIPGSIFAGITAGYLHSCALTSFGAAYCWGRNGGGEVGDGTTIDRTSPVEVETDVHFLAIAAGTGFTCGIDLDHLLWCWGDLTSVTSTTTPSLVAIAGVQLDSLVAGRQHACGLTASGAAYCWGRNSSGQIGDGTLVTQKTPVRVNGVPAFTAIGAGDDFTCGLDATRRIWCWGGNAEGELGDGTTANRPTPAVVADSLLFVALGVGGDHVCGATTDGDLFCWGDNGRLQLGNFTSESRSLRPLRVPNLNTPRFDTVFGGGAHGCALAGTERILYCWGKNQYGQVGVGRTSDASMPSRVIQP